MKIFILASSPDSLKIFRGQLILDLIRDGHDVVTCAPELLEHKEVVAWLEDHSVTCLNAPFSRASLSPLGDFKALVRLTKMLIDLKPCIFLAYTIKPVIWGGLAARLARVKKRIALITGLGYAFTGKPRGKRRVIQSIVRMLYRISLKGMQQIFFQNPDDMRDFQGYGLIPLAAKVDVVNGSGVDTELYSYSPVPSTPLRFLLIARLLGDKGIREYVNAASMIKRSHSDIEFDLVGGLDPNPDGLSEDEVRSWADRGIVNWYGKQTDVRTYLKRCHVYVLPSYREGTPRSVLEAMSSGRAIITTDAPGCKETVVDGHNGFLVPVKDAKVLASAMKIFIDKPSLIKEMGYASRKLAEDKYDVHKVNAFMLERIFG